MITQPGTDEFLKGSVHAFLAGVLTIVTAYNGAAWRDRHEPYLAANTVGYAIATVWELYQTWKHISEPSVRLDTRIP